MDIVTLTLAKNYTNKAIGEFGLQGKDGKSAYQIAVENGFTGTEQEWLNSLQGPVGPAGADGAPGRDGADGAPGPAGQDGAPGKDGKDGEDYVLTDSDRTEIANAVQANINPTLTEIRETAEQAETIARGRATAYVYNTVEELETALANEEFVASLVKGDNFYIKALDVPDYWWDGTAKQQLETEKPDLSGLVKDVQINDASIVNRSSGIASISRATSNIYGVIKGDPQSRLYGIDLLNPGILGLWDTSTTEVSTRSGVKAITTKVFDYAVKVAMCDGKGTTWTEEEQAGARERIGAVSSSYVTTAINDALSAIGVAEEGTY